MKNFKRILTGLFCCTLVLACCFSLVGCKNEDETPPATTPVEETISLTAEQAEMIYYDALLNSLNQKQRHETLTTNTRIVGQQFEEAYSTIVVLKDGVSYLKEDEDVSWIIDHKLYTVKDKKYYESYGPIDIHDGALELAQLQAEADTQETIFLGGEKTGDSYTIGVRYSYVYDGVTATFHITAKIENNLLMSYTMSLYSYCEDDLGDGYFKATISYENVNFPTAIPTDLNTYTKAD